MKMSSTVSRFWEREGMKNEMLFKCVIVVSHTMLVDENKILDRWISVICRRDDEEKNEKGDV